MESPRKRGRVELVARVRARRGELEDAIFSRIREGSYSSLGDADAEYLAGLRATVTATIGHALTVLDHGEDETDPAPAQVIAQARLAARFGVNLDTVLRRYVLGSTVLGDVLVQEAARSDLAEHHGIVLRELLSAQAGLLERLLAAITTEYSLELERAGRSPERRLVERVQLLLSGAPGDLIELGYDIDGWHVGVIASGASAGRELGLLAAALDRRLLYVPCGDQTAWAWLGGRDALTTEEFDRALPGAGIDESSASSARRPGTAGSGLREPMLALGEPGRGPDGWRRTHRQAQAAMHVALRSPRPLTRYADVALLAAVLGDDLLADSMVDVYLSALGDRNGAGAVLRETLRAYYAAERNASSAASALGVTRHTVENRLRAIEQKLGHPLRTRQAELEVALRLDELTRAGR